MSSCVSYCRLDDTHFLYERIFFLTDLCNDTCENKVENSNNSIAIKKTIVDSS